MYIQRQKMQRESVFKDSSFGRMIMGRYYYPTQI